MLRLALAAAIAALGLPPATASARDSADTALNVVPSGQWGGVPVPPGAESQAELYDSLTPRFDQVTRRTSRARSSPSAPASARTEKVPRRGVKIVRDRYDVPHITGRKRDDVTWAMGWVLQEDRGLLLAQGRYPARLAAVYAPNVNAFGLVTGLKTVRPSRQINRTIRRNGMRALLSAGRDGRRLLHDIDVFVAGLNARLRAEKSKAKPFTRIDLFATNALIGQLFGEGGGGESRRGAFLGALRARLGASAAQTLFDDLSEHTDPDTPAMIRRSFPYGTATGRRRGNAILDAGSLQRTTTAGASAASAPRTPRWASNFLILGRGRSTTGHPLFVGGPQIATSTRGSRSRPTSAGPATRRAASTRPRTPGRS